MTIYNWITLVVIVLGWATTYGKLCQKLNELERRQDTLDNDVKATRAWGETEIAKAVAERNSSFVRKDVFNAQHAELCAQVREILDLKLPAFFSRIETNQTQLSLDIAKLQVAVEKISEKLMETK